MLACLRSHGLPARYVSGYLLTEPPPGRPRLLGADASHAWVAAYSPPHGWVEFDPTNDHLADRRYITLACGADFADVVPLRGVILGGRGQTMKRRGERHPALKPRARPGGGSASEGASGVAVPPPVDGGGARRVRRLRASPPKSRHAARTLGARDRVRRRGARIHFRRRRHSRRRQRCRHASVPSRRPGLVRFELGPARRPRRREAGSDDDSPARLDRGLPRALSGRVARTLSPSASTAIA